jgi:glycosyltransferase involved in cell wall biosynthesis
MSEHQPHVTVLTPVYNGEGYIAECIESVIAQRYTNWEYVIVNNCSTDKTLEIAERYAATDPRVRIVNNAKFVDVIENHNIAFALLSPESKYCKVVSADDWIYPECLERLVDVAERNPSVGIVCCYGVTNKGFLPSDVSSREEVLSGASACRRHLLGSHVLSAPTMLLYRADLVRARRPFFTIPLPSADFHACFELLQHSDFGFVYQVLCFVRVHEEALSSKLARVNSFLVDRLDFVVTFGSSFLTSRERDERVKELLSVFYEELADRSIHFAGREFRTYHRDRLLKLGHPISNVRLAGVVSNRILDWVGNPKRTVEKVLMRLESRFTLT